jgi:PQQ-dependent dehydrogenase (methanol/ethanol family)
MIKNALALGLVALLSLAITACDRKEVTAQPAAPQAAQAQADSAPAAAPKTAPAVTPANVDTQRLRAADKEPESWMSHGRTYNEQRFSPLTQISTVNVGELGLAWAHDLNTPRGIEATSIVVDGVMYTTSAWSIVHALDARTGESLWTFDPEVAKDKVKHTCCGPVNRGVAVWQGQVFFGALDGRLFALNAKNGEVNWEVATFDSALPYTITGAPRVVRDKVLIGNGGAEFGVRGFISAYNIKDGSLAWRFYTVPGDPALGFENDAMKMAAQTWTGQWWKLGGGGGTVWDSMAYDPELDLL